MIKILRYLVAIVFIASAFVKGVDPKGFSFKLEEYFSPTVFHIPFLHDQALNIALFVVFLEFVLGIALLLRLRLKSTLISLIALCVFFAFLTFYSAYYKVVTDCGCFGDALKLEPWQSFYKDLILLFLLLIIYISYAKNPQKWEVKSGFFKKTVLAFGLVLFAYYAYVGTISEPLIDFRSYKIGVNLREEREKIDKNPSVYKMLYVLKNKKTGEETQVNQDDYINKNYWKDSNLELLSDKSSTQLYKEGYISSIDKFKLTKNNFDETDVVLGHPKLVLLCAYQPDLISKQDYALLEQKLLELKKRNTFVAFVSNKTGLMQQVDQYEMDGTAIKTIARSNPFVLLLEEGEIVAKENAFSYFGIKK